MRLVVTELFPEEALAIFRETQYDPDATFSYEAMSGGLLWSDEGFREVAEVCVPNGSWAFRSLIGYRASLTCGEPRLELQPVWDQVVAECPDWPGLRKDRRSIDAAAVLAKRNEAFTRKLDELDKRLH